MRAVGVRELKDRLSHYLQLVEAGESVVVTHRGSVIAELRPPGPTTIAAEAGPGVHALVREGRAVAGADHDPGLYAPRSAAVPKGSVRDLLDAERGEGA